jgi:LCP family protein required for cell wall assembly
LLSVMAGLGLGLVACSPIPASTPPATRPEPILTSTGATASSVATTAPAVFLPDAPPEWQQLVANIYGAACDGDRVLAPAVVAGLPEADACPTGGSTDSATVDRWTLVVSELGEDALYGVGSDAGWNVVAFRLPSLGQHTGWYGVVPKVVAAVGSDARPGQEPAESRADSIHLIGLDGAGRGGVLGIPRDSWVTISGGGRNKVNASLSLGGPSVMLQTLADITGLNLDGYVLTGFVGFQEMMGNVLGGVDVELANPIFDRAAGADLPAGDQYLNGPQALALARARKSQEQGDLTRQRNGGLLLLAALKSVQAYGPSHLPALLAGSAPWINTDLSLDELLSFAALAIDTPVEAIGNVVAPGRVGTAGSASVVYLTDAATAVFTDLADGALAP